MTRKNAAMKKAVTLGVLSCGLLLYAAAGLAQEKIEGKVVRTDVTVCDMNVKVGGCAGTLTIERKAGDKTEQLTINVPLGTPIKRGIETAYLPALRGKTVAVTQMMEKNERVAKAIEQLN